MNNYMNKSLEERQAHLKPDDPCDFDWGQKLNSSNHYRGMLAREYFGEWIGTGPIKRAQACHYCGQGSRSNELTCKNPNHIYWGTPKENMDDTRRHNNLPNSHLTDAQKKEIMMNNKWRKEVKVTLFNGRIIHTPSQMEAARILSGEHTNHLTTRSIVAQISHILNGRINHSFKYNIKSVEIISK